MVVLSSRPFCSITHNIAPVGFTALWLYKITRTWVLVVSRLRFKTFVKKYSIWINLANLPESKQILLFSIQNTLNFVLTKTRMAQIWLQVDFVYQQDIWTLIAEITYLITYLSYLPSLVSPWDGVLAKLVLAQASFAPVWSDRSADLSKRSGAGEAVGLRKSRNSMRS